MTEGLYLRRCRKHQLNLEEYGEHLVCPAGETHICEDANVEQMNIEFVTESLRPWYVLWEQEFVVIDRATGRVVNEVPDDETDLADPPT